MKASPGYTARLLEKAGKCLAGRFSRDRVPLSVIYDRFRRVLDNHNRALEIITDMGEKLGGEYLFDITYLRRSYTELRENISESIESFEVLTGGKYKELKEIFGGINREVNRLLFAQDSSSRELVLSFEEITWDRRSETGGKNANLAVLKNELRLPVPDGFSITTAAFNEFMQHNGIDTMLASLGDGVEIAKAELGEIRDAILRGALPPALDAETDRALGKLAMRCGEKCRLAVRSSASEEDGEFSFAGQYDTVLNVPLEATAVKKAYKQVVASLYTEKSAAYHRQAGLDIRTGRMAVGCLLMVDAKASGVLYSTDPAGKRSSLLISSTWGLGKTIVEGQADADSYFVTKGPQPALKEVRIGRKTLMVFSKEGSGTTTISTPSGMSERGSLTEAEALELAGLGAMIEDHFRTPQDIEWAMGKEGRLFFLQARPLRITEEALPQGRKTASIQDVPLLLKAKGLVVQPGAGAGKVFVLKHMDDLEHFPRGAVLVAHNDSSNFIRVMPFASAIITDAGTLTSHMAAICREFRVPTVVNTGDASSVLHHGQEVTLLTDEEGSAMVYEGVVGELLTTTRAGAMRMDEIYEFRKKRYVLRFISPLHLLDPFFENFTPLGCKTIHDILRFIHEKSVGELIDRARDGERTKAAVKLDLPVPAGIMVADIGGGLNAVRTGRNATFEDVASIPFRAILKGMMHPGAWHAETVALQAQDFFSSMMRMPDIVSDSKTYLSYNIAVISRDYVNLNLRAGYHYNMLDCYCSEKARDNHVYFRFTGGATDIIKRSRRIELIARVLREYGFNMKMQGDLLIARLSNISREEMEIILDQTGRLMAFTRQLDAVLHDDNKIEQYATNFLKGKYEL
jgi:pyruvate,water dikinase